MDNLAVQRLTECCICFNIETNVLLAAGNSEKLLKNCQTHLDSSIWIDSFENGTSFSCCSYCYESAHQLTLLEEQVEKLQKEISRLSEIFSKNVLDRRDQFKNVKNDTSNSFTFHKNAECHSIVLIEDANKMVCENLTKDIPSYDHGKKENEYQVPNPWIDSDEQETVITDTCLSSNPPCDDVDVKYSYEEAAAIFLDSSAKEISPNQQTTQNAQRNQPTITTSITDLLKILKVPVIQLKRLPTAKKINSSKINENHKKGNGLVKNQYLQDRKKLYNKKDLYKCAFCDKLFQQPGLLKKHEMYHSGERPFSCAFCPKSFITATILRKHTKIHSGSRPYNCSSCEKCFTDAAGLRQHEKSHSEDKPFKCSICPASFKRIKNLREHKIFHSGEKPYQCSFCEKCFRRSDRRKEHEKTHSSKKKSNKCPQCDKCYTQKTHLALHVKTVHTFLAKVYSCSFCTKSFNLPGKLKRHELVHTGERPYKCSSCEKTFTQKHYLTQHELIHKEITEEFILP